MTWIKILTSSDQTVRLNIEHITAIAINMDFEMAVFTTGGHKWLTSDIKSIRNLEAMMIENNPP